MFRLVAAEVAPELDLRKYLAEHALGPEKWTPQSSVEEITVGGTPASRFTLSRTQAKDELRREVTAFRRAGRAYFFIVDFAASDGASRDLARSAVGSVSWSH